MIAGFIAMLWLVPFDTISLTVSLPFELKLDRIVLPFIIVAWVVSLLVGGRNAPRLRMTKIHIAVGGYVAVAILSIIVNVTWLNRQLLLLTSIKAMLLLASYATFFVIVASVVRASEVRAFVKYSLGLAVLCGFGALWEYKFHYNPFYQFSHALLPSGLFNVPVPNANAVDELGRRLTLGPAEEPLELAAMSAIALPIAMVGVMEAKRRRDQILYGLAACMMLAAGVSTFRKSSLVLPVMVIASLATLRPRQLARLWPIVPVIFVVVHIAAPGAIGGVIEQLDGSRLTNADTTVSRTDGYDVVRPYLWTNPAFGEGYGSYNASVIYIFDSQILDQLITTGVVGLLAYLVMSLSVLVTARPLFKVRGSPTAPLALGLGVSAVVFFSASFLYDEMGFPHVPYIFLTFAGFVAVLAGDPGALRSAPARAALAGRARPLSSLRSLPAEPLPLIAGERWGDAPPQPAKPTRQRRTAAGLLSGRAGTVRRERGTVHRDRRDRRDRRARTVRRRRIVAVLVLACLTLGAAWAAVMQLGIATSSRPATHSIKAQSVGTVSAGSPAIRNRAAGHPASSTVRSPGPAAALAAALTQALTPVNLFRNDLDGLRSGSLQSRGLMAIKVAALERAVGTALARLSAPAGNREALAALRSALSSEAGGFAALAAAAAGNNRTAYASARLTVQRASQLLSAAAGSLRREGFVLPALPALELAALPAAPRRSRSHTAAGGNPNQAAAVTQPALATTHAPAAPVTQAPAVSAPAPASSGAPTTSSRNAAPATTTVVVPIVSSRPSHPAPSTTSTVVVPVVSSPPSHPAPSTTSTVVVVPGG